MKRFAFSAQRRRLLKVIGMGAIALPAIAACNTETNRYEINIVEQNQLAPASLTVPRGATVVWRNVGTLPQTITCDPGASKDATRVRLPQGAKPWDSGVIYPGQFFTYRFDTAGSYLYYSRMQDVPSMRGVISVTE